MRLPVNRLVTHLTPADGGVAELTITIEQEASRRTRASPPQVSGQVDGNNRALPLSSRRGPPIETSWIARTAEPDASQVLRRGLPSDVQKSRTSLLHLSDYDSLIPRSFD